MKSRDNSVEILPQVKTKSVFGIIQKQRVEDIFSLPNYYRILRDQKEAKSADKL